MSLQISKSKKLNLSFEQALNRVIEELGKQGFGIITSIDVMKTLKEKINQDFRKYTILGACNPVYAHRALEIDDKIGLLLPCNVVVQEKDNAVEVSIFNPELITFLFKEEKFRGLIEELQDKIEIVLQNI